MKALIEIVGEPDQRVKKKLLIGGIAYPPDLAKIIAPILQDHDLYQIKDRLDG